MLICYICYISDLHKRVKLPTTLDEKIYRGKKIAEIAKKNLYPIDQIEDHRWYITLLLIDHISFD